MSDASDLQHHLEEGLLLLTRGMVFEAREAWRKALQIEPSNPVALDYIDSTDCELNPYDRQREAEAARAQRTAPRPHTGGWEDDELEVIAAGPADEEDDSITRGGSVTGFMVADEEPDGEAAAPVNGSAASGWVGVPDEEDSASSWEADGGEPPATGAADEAAATAEAAPRARAARGVSATRGGARPEHGEEWEPLSWMDEDTPAAAVAAQDWANRAQAAADQGRGRGPNEGSSRRGGGDGARAEGRAAGGKGTRDVSGSRAAKPAAVRSGQPDGVEKPGATPVASAAGPNPPEPVAPPEPSVDVMLEMASKALQQGRPEPARALLLKVLQKEPGLRSAAQHLERAERELQERYERILGSADGVPMLSRSLTDLTNLDLDQVGGYILSRIDGILTLDDIYTLSAHIDRLTVMRILSELIDTGIITIRR